MEWPHGTLCLVKYCPEKGLLRWVHHQKVSGYLDEVKQDYVLISAGCHVGKKLLTVCSLQKAGIDDLYLR